MVRLAHHERQFGSKVEGLTTNGNQAVLSKVEGLTTNGIFCSEVVDPQHGISPRTETAFRTFLRADDGLAIQCSAGSRLASRGGFGLIS
jgi:hypothetical protein